MRSIPGLLALVFAIAICTLPAMASEPDGETSSILEKCLAGATGKTDIVAAKRACIGRAAQVCMENPDNQSTHGMADCARREADWWDGLLNARYKQLMGHLEPHKQKAMRDIQRKWIAFRDAECRYSRELQFDGGTMGITSAAWCMLDATALRTLDLGHHLEMYNR